VAGVPSLEKAESCISRHRWERFIAGMGTHMMNRSAR